MPKRSKLLGRSKRGPIDPAVTSSGIYAAVGPKKHKGVGMIGMGQGSDESGLREPMPEHAINASNKRAGKATHHENLSASSFSRRAAAARKQSSDDEL